MSFQIPLRDYDPELKKEYEYWEAYMKMSDRALGRFHRIAIKYHGCVTCSMVFSNSFPPEKARYMEVLYKLKLPKGLKSRFEEEWGGSLEAPLKITVSDT